MAKITDEQVRGMMDGLKEFGYPVDFAYCRKSVDDLMEGKDPVGGPQGFIQGWLREAKLLPDA
ncbi:hypothetical protein LCGC14_2212640 [marine sediment metagenome]|uniref:Uncharacterized protein n=1 Tax=marine sediment metagenome TaxID=412755 RepID=A0A0F9DDF3_9ZZZZ